MHLRKLAFMYSTIKMDLIINGSHLIDYSLKKQEDMDL